MLLLLLPVHADEQQTFFYEYDAAGNIVGVRAVQVAGAPIVDSIQPDFLNRDALVSFTVTGSNLSAVVVSTPVASLSISTLQHVSDAEIRFSLFTTDAPLGAASLVFTNLLGSAAQTVTISERLPVIATSPSPLLLTEGSTRDVAVLLDVPFENTVELIISVSDTAVAGLPNGVTSSREELTLNPGETEFSFSVQGLTSGATAINLSVGSEQLGSSLTITVAAPEPLPSGPHRIASKTVGIRLDPIGRTSTTIHASPVGLNRRVSVAAGEAVQAQAVGVSKRINVEAGESIETRPVGIELQTE